MKHLWLHVALLFLGVMLPIRICFSQINDIDETCDSYNDATMEAPSCYRYIPGTPMQLGQGIDPLDLAHPKQLCIKFATSDKTASTPQTGPTTPVHWGQVKLYYTRNASELREVSGLSVHADASYLDYFSGGNTYKLDTTETAKSDATTLVFSISEDYEPVQISGDSSLLANLPTDKSELAKKCGTQQVQWVYPFKRLSVFMTIYDLDHDYLSTNGISANGKFEVYGFTGSSKVSLDKEIQRATHDSRLVFNAESAGCELTSDLKQGAIAAAAKKPADVYTALVDYLTTTTKQCEKSKPASRMYIVTDFPGTDGEHRSLWSNLKMDKLLALKATYRKYKEAFQSMRSLMEDPLDKRTSWLTSDQKAVLGTTRDSILRYLDRLRAAHSDCLATLTTEVENVEQVCKAPDQAPEIPTFLAPIRGTDIDWTVIVDHDPWIGAKAEAVIANPPVKRPLIERVKSIQDATSAFLGVRVKSYYTAKMWFTFTTSQAVNAGGTIQYKDRGKTAGDDLVPNRQKDEEFLVINGNYDPFPADQSASATADLDFKPLWKWFLNTRQCIQRPRFFDENDRIVNGNIFLNVLNRFGTTRRFPVATWDATSATITFEGFVNNDNTGLRIHPLWGGAAGKGAGWSIPLSSPSCHS